MLAKHLFNKKEGFMNKIFKFRATEDEINIIKERSQKHGLTMSEFVRQAALNSVIVKHSTKELNKLIWEVNKIGTNINQIARLCNESDYVSKQSLQKLQEEHFKVYKVFENFILPKDFYNHLVDITK